MAIAWTARDHARVANGDHDQRFQDKATVSMGHTLVEWGRETLGYRSKEMSGYNAVRLGMQQYSKKLAITPYANLAVERDTEKHARDPTKKNVCSQFIPSF